MNRKNKFYLHEGEVWKSDDKNLRFFKLADPDAVMKYAGMSPDMIDRFEEITPNPETYRKDAPKEKLYRIITDTSTVIFLNEDSFHDISGNVSAYLQETEEWERMCVVRDIGKFYLANLQKRKAEIEKQIKLHEKPAAKGKP